MSLTVLDLGSSRARAPMTDSQQRRLRRLCVDPDQRLGADRL